MVTLKFTSCVTLETVAIVALYHGCEKSCEGRPGYEAIAIRAENQSSLTQLKKLPPPKLETNNIM